MPVPNGGPLGYSAATRGINLCRDNVLNTIHEWIADPQKSTLCLIAPPGEGKSWVLSYLNEELKANASFPVFFLDDPQQYMRSIPGPQPVYELDEDAINIWIDGCYTTARGKYGAAIPPFLPAVYKPEVSITLLAEAICRLDPEECKALAIIDGFDEMPEQCQEIFSDRVLDRFIKQNFEHGRKVLMILAQRNGAYHYSIPIQEDYWTVPMTDGVNQPALGQVLVPTPATLITDWDQFQLVHRILFLRRPPVSKQAYEKWKAPLSYSFDNFFINHYLFACGLNGASRKLNMINCNHLRQCAVDLLERPRPVGPPRFPELRPGDFEILLGIALLDNVFSGNDLDRVLRTIVPKSGYTRFTHPFINNLRTVYCVIEPDPETRLLYRLNPSLRAILRDYNALAHPPAKKPQPNTPGGKGRKS